MEKLGSHLKAARLQAGLSQRELALLLGQVVGGVPNNNEISRYETGKGQIPPWRWEAFIGILDMPVVEAWRAWGIDLAEHSSGIQLDHPP
jgi:hypothetical protein